MTYALRTGDQEFAGAIIARRVAQIPSRTARHWPNSTPTRPSQFNQGMRLMVFDQALYDPRLAELISVPPVVYSALRGVYGELERAQRELERLQDGWAGPGTVAPSERTKQDVERLLTIFSEITRAPEVEVDEESGHVTLRWSGAITLAFVLRGNGKVLVINTDVSDRPVVKSRTFEIQKDEASINRYVMSEAGDTLSGS